MDDAFPATGLFVPKPGRGAGCQRHGIPDLQSTVRQRPLASLAGGADRYSVGYSPSPGHARPTVADPPIDDSDRCRMDHPESYPLQADENVEDHFIRRRDLAMAVMPRVLGQSAQADRGL